MGNVLGITVASMTTGKRTKNVLTWDEYFMSVAFLSGQRSKDPATQVGACIVNMDKRIAGVGYNGMPNQCSDDNMPWAKSDPHNLETKGHYVCHAELNAIVNKLQADIRGCKIYVSLYPCNECAKLIIQSGIKEVIYFSDKYHDRVSSQAARRLFEEANVKTTNYAELSPRTKVDIDFEAINSPF